MAAAGQTDVFSTVGTTIAVVGGLPATQTESGYGALTYTLVGMVDEIGLPTSSYDSEEFSVLATGSKIKINTFLDSGELTVSCADAPEEDGQAILVDYHTGTNARDYLSVKITYPNGAIRYYNGMVDEYSPAIGGVNTAEFTIGVSGVSVYVG